MGKNCCPCSFLGLELVMDLSAGTILIAGIACIGACIGIGVASASDPNYDCRGSRVTTYLGRLSAAVGVLLIAIGAIAYMVTSVVK